MGKKQLYIKAIEDYFIGIFCVILFLPLILILSVIIKLTSKGPVIFKEYRRGLHGNPFTIYKFRSFYIDKNSNQNTGYNMQYYNSRPTSIGLYLRKIGLDELPQFLNVIQGKMSVIGPRPHSIKDDEYFSQYIEVFQKRYQIKPGITGWAQVNDLIGAKPSIKEMKKRVEYDFYYMHNWSLKLDIKIILLTIKYIAKKIFTFHKIAPI